jgi:hypothetical protein
VSGLMAEDEETPYPPGVSRDEIIIFVDFSSKLGYIE